MTKRKLPPIVKVAINKTAHACGLAEAARARIALHEQAMQALGAGMGAMEVIALLDAPSRAGAPDARTTAI